ncbi:hypothetical protein H0X06_05010 [Candidatus Dependentiae bacterium]|nr:hypothetical protein [Candidatus Dependentiae bacterium]
MRKIFILCFFTVSANCESNPFCPRIHSYRYTACGVMHSTQERIGIVWIDGTSYCVRTGDCVAGHVIDFLDDESIVVVDERGDKKKSSKNPSTYIS